MFKINDKTAEELSVKLEASAEIPFISSTRDKTVTVLKRDGVYDFGADMEILQFNLPLRFIGARNVSEVQQLAREFAKEFRDEKGKLKTVKLSFDLEPDKFYNVRYMGAMPIQRLAGQGIFDLPLTAFEPYAFSDAQEYDEVLLYDDGHEYDTGLIYPNTESFEFQHQRHLSSLYNYGDLETPLDLEIQGRFSNLKITNQSTGQVFELNTSVSKETVVIDMGEEEIKIGNSNGLKHHEGDFIFLQLGENKLVFEADNPDATVTYNWKNRF